MQIDQLTFDSLFFVLMVIAIAGVLWMPLTWLLLSIFTPKTLLEKYFKEPHFSLTETIMMAQFPGFLIRTGIFAWLSLRPSLDKKRGIKNIDNYIPLWYAVSLKIFMLGVLLTLFLFVFLMGFLLIFKPPV